MSTAVSTPPTATAAGTRPDTASEAPLATALDAWELIAAVANQPTRAAAAERLVHAVAEANGSLASAASASSAQASSAQASSAQASGSLASSAQASGSLASSAQASGSLASGGGRVVRLLWGTETKISRIYDSRLGRLGTESSLWHESSLHWRRLNAAPRGVLRSGSDCIVRLSEPEGPGRALLWIASPVAGGAAREMWDTLEQAAPALAAVFWNRPSLGLYRSWQRGLWQHGRRMRLVAAAAAAVAVVALLPVPYRVHCQASVDAVRQRLIAAPFEATLLECAVQPGDRVAEGELLALLDGRPLRLELEALQADSGRAQRQRDAALASGRIAESQLADLEARQLQRRIELLEQRLAGLEIRSPIEGVIVSGDLRKAIGSPLEVGKPLWEIAPLERMTIEVEIPERDIRYVAADAAACVRLDAAATEMLEGRLDVLYPAAEVRDERNVFVGQWELENPGGGLRPGMRGTAVLYGPRRPLAWPLLRRVTEAALRSIGW
ncbi:efflux RND transporter periplasmic adaptor subunit [Candidatus Laterigemmans baculatus]|uniref:efflux RND transporter periplasmic adaptor subunit n=1 Tax=Candidatus Laterigemmans baculatus TaxID=2770505 RepID=UPI0013DC2B7E|nr:efflux RND transporter periplasmic adaptor subunit [Candidatus Laterigemmans baculatus]